MERMMFKEVRHLIFFHILKFLTEQSLKEYYDFVLNPKDIIKFCYFVIKQKRIDCPKPVYGLEMNVAQVSVVTLDLFDNLNDSIKDELVNSEIKEYREKITLELNSQYYNFLFIYTKQFDEDLENSVKSFVIQNNFINNMFYKSNVLHQIRNNQNRCQKKNEQIFENNFVYKCLWDCLLGDLNKKYSRLPIM